MFSATMPQAIAEIARKFQKDPVTVRVIKKELTVPKVTQYYYEVKPKNKVEVMSRLLDMYAGAPGKRIFRGRTSWRFKAGPA